MPYIQGTGTTSKVGITNLTWIEVKFENILVSPGPQFTLITAN